MVSSVDFAQSLKHLNFTPSVVFNRTDSSDSNENDGIAFNGKMVAVHWKQTASIAVFNADKPQTFSPAIPLLKGHTGQIYDMQWNPFQERLLASCADDGKVNLWVFDDFEGCTEVTTEADMVLDAHPRKTICLRWHESVENLMATCAIDKTVRIWDINEDRADDAIFTFTEMEDFATSLRWSPNGKNIAAPCKNKQVLILDPRQADSAMKAGIHQGPRQQRLEWIDDESIITTGFDSSAKRQYGVWDLRNMEQPLSLGPLNEGSGIPFFHYDREFGGFFLVARGDNNIGCYHLDKSKQQILTNMQMFPFSSTQKAFTIGPKHCVNVGKQEVMRAVRATNKSTIEVLQMIIPSRIGGFN